MNKRKIKQVQTLLKKLAGGTLFKVVFVKRTTGELREMVCRFGVSKGVTGEGLKFDPLEKGLIVVFDMQKKAYRSIPVENIQKLVIRGEVFDLEGGV